MNTPICYIHRYVLMKHSVQCYPLIQHTFCTYQLHSQTFVQFIHVKVIYLSNRIYKVRPFPQFHPPPISPNSSKCRPPCTYTCRRPIPLAVQTLHQISLPPSTPHIEHTFLPCVTQGFRHLDIKPSTSFMNFLNPIT